MILIPLLMALSVAETRWPAILACPQVSVPGNVSGTGVVIGTKDGFAYLLTSAHVIGDFEGIRISFTSLASYPKPVWYPDRVEVLGRWPDPDLALLRFPTGKQSVAVLQLAPAWQRPKAFPVAAWSIGVGGERAAMIQPDKLEGKEFVARDGKQLAMFWKTESAPAQGRSGGPLLDGKGRVIGLAVASSGGKGYYAHHDEILAALKRSGAGWLVPRP